jgi:hypothetical protein
MEKDIIILNLLIGWEIIHLSKNGNKLSIRLREFSGKHSRFFRINFSKCSLVVILDFAHGVQTEDLSSFNFKGCIFSQINMENDRMISIHLLKQSEFVVALKIMSNEIEYDFSTK